MAIHMVRMAGLPVSLEEREEDGGGFEDEDGRGFDEEDTVIFNSITEEDVEVQMDEPEDDDDGEILEADETFDSEDIEFQVRVNSDNELETSLDSEDKLVAENQGAFRGWDRGQEVQQGAKEHDGGDYLRLCLPRLNTFKQPMVKDEFLEEGEERREVSLGLEEGEERREGSLGLEEVAYTAILPKRSLFQEEENEEVEEVSENI